MEKYISIPNVGTRPNVLVSVSNILKVGLPNTQLNQVLITPINKGNDVVITYTAPTALATGTTTTFNTGNVLIDTSATFVTAGVKVGDTVVDTGGSGRAKVVSVDSETQLTLDNLIITSTSTQPYSIYVDLDAPAKFIQSAMLEALQSQWIDPIYEITDVPFTITSIST
jgi:hypothetical protein